MCTVFCVCGLCTRSAWAQGEPAADDSEEESGPGSESALTPPEVLESVEATYPLKARAAGREGRVELTVTVLADGSVGEVEVATSGGEELDVAAVAAVRQWRFKPARRGDEAVAARITIPFQFSLTEQEQAETDAPQLAQKAPTQITVRGEREVRTEERAVSDFRVERDVLVAAPRQEGAEVLRSAPGLYIGRAEGPAVAHNFMLRGFDAAHGQDIEFRVGGLPINMPSHIHGQGYSDLGFLIADTVQGLRVSEGVYDPRQGDFAVAGSIDVQLGVQELDRGVRLQTGYGSFDTQRQLVLWAPREAPEETFGAVQYMTTDGFGENRAGQSGSGVFQHRFGKGDLTYRAITILHAARSELAGVVRKDDVKSGRVCFTCVYPYPTARSQNALANRFLAGLFANHAGPDGANGEVGFWLGYDNFRLQENFTGFLQRSRTLERVSGRGDLIEQQNQTFSLGLTGRYRTSPFRPTSWARGTLEVGADGRLDTIDQSQNLLDASVRNQTWDQRVDATVRAVDLGVWGDLEGRITKHLIVRAGARADVLSYDIEDRLGNFAPVTRPQDTFIRGFRRSALGVAWGPRTSVEVRPSHWVSLLAAYGEGYRSPQARLLEDGEPTPFSKVKSADAGVRFDWGDPLRLAAGGFYTHLSDDIAFEAAEGRLERIGETQRIGAFAHAVTRPVRWMVGSVSVTFVDATLLEPPPPTADEPQPPFEEGQNLPFVPPLVVRVDQGATHTFVDDAWGQPFDGRAGFGFSYLSPRPLPFGDFADPVTLIDASAGVSWGPVDLDLELFNVLNAEYAAIEYSFASDWNPNDGVRPRTPARHTAAGAPFSWMLLLGVIL